MGRRNRIEWAVLAVSVLAVGAVLGVLVFEGFTDRGRPPLPVVTLHLERAHMTATGWVLPASVTNEGDRSAQAVTLIAIATIDGHREDAEITVDYLPAGTQVALAFGFSGKPDGEVRVRVTGYLP